MSKEVQTLFTEIAPKYDFLNHFLSLSIDRKWRNQAMEALKDQPYPRVLDLCAGTLDLTVRLLEQYPDSHVTALDFSLAMLEHGKSKIKSNRRSDLLCADGHHLPFRDQSFDAILCAFGIRNLENRRQAASEIKRLLKNQGKLVVLEFFRPENFFSKLFYQTYGKHVIPRIGGVFSKNREAYEYLQNSIQDFFSVGEYCHLLKEFDLEVTHAQPLSGGIAHLLVAEAK